MFFPIILILCSLIAYFVGSSFATLSTKFSNYGGSYLYVKEGLGKKWSFIVGWAQYIQAPFVAISALAGIVWAFQSTNFFGIHINADTFKTAAPYLFIATLFCFVILIIIVNLGFNSTKGSLFFLWGLKWLILLGALIFCISKIIALGVDGHASQIIDNLRGSGFHFTPTLTSLISSILTFFFAFGGIEGVAVISDDVENPKINMRKILLGIIFLSSSFYFVYYFVFLAALGGTGGIAGNATSNTGGQGSSSAPNAINLIINDVFSAGPALLFAAVTSFAVLSQVANKFTSRLQNGWVNTRMILSLAVDGWLPRSLCHVNKKNQYSKCLLMDSIITLALCGLYVIAVFVQPKYQVALANSLSIYTLIAFIQYVLTMIACIKLHYKKVVTMHKFEVYGTLCTLVFVILLVILFFVQGILSGVQSGLSSDDFQNFVFQFIGYAIAIASGVFVYYLGKYKKWDQTKFPKSYSEFIVENKDEILHVEHHIKDFIQDHPDYQNAFEANLLLISK